MLLNVNSLLFLKIVMFNGLYVSERAFAMSFRVVGFLNLYVFLDA